MWICKLTAIHEHLLSCNYSPSFEDFSILTMESKDFKLKIMESLLITRDKPVLKKADSLLPFELFWYSISGYQCFITSCDATLSNCAYTVVVCSVFNIMLRALVFYQKQNVWAFKIILCVTMKAVAFES